MSRVERPGGLVQRTLIRERSQPRIRVRDRDSSRVVGGRRARGTGFLYVLPALAFLLLFDIWPIFFGFWMSLWRWGVKAEQFIGFGNYGRIFREELLQRSFDGTMQPGGVGNALLVTVYFALGTVPLTMAIGFGIAVLLFQNLRGRDLMRTIYFLPYITPVVAGAMVFAWIFNPQVGVANAVLQRFGIGPQQWLNDATPLLKHAASGLGITLFNHLPDAYAGPSVALACIILFTIWASVGFHTVIFLAGLSNIPGELYEAARLDGASGWQVTRAVTLPLLSPTIFFLAVVSTIGAFQGFNALFILSNGTGGPSGTTESITLHIFKNFYQRPDSTGYAAAVSFILFFILLGLTLVQFRVAGRKVHYQ